MHPGATIVTALSWYAAIGAAVAVVFALVVGRVVPTARGGSIGFRVLILPGAALLWPLVLVRTVLALVRPSPAEHAHEEKKA